jgi:hypothetical protein
MFSRTTKSFVTNIATIFLALRFKIQPPQILIDTKEDWSYAAAPSEIRAPKKVPKDKILRVCATICNLFPAPLAELRWVSFPRNPCRGTPATFSCTSPNAWLRSTREVQGWCARFCSPGVRRGGDRAPGEMAAILNTPSKIALKNCIFLIAFSDRIFRLNFSRHFLKGVPGHAFSRRPGDSQKVRKSKSIVKTRVKTNLVEKGHPKQPSKKEFR